MSRRLQPCQTCTRRLVRPFVIHTVRPRPSGQPGDADGGRSPARKLALGANSAFPYQPHRRPKSYDASWVEVPPTQPAQRVTASCPASLRQRAVLPRFAETAIRRGRDESRQRGGGRGCSRREGTGVSSRRRISRAGRRPAPLPGTPMQPATHETCRHRLPAELRLF